MQENFALAGKILQNKIDMIKYIDFYK